MGDNYGLTYLNFDELGTVTPTTSDFLPVYDASAGKWAKVAASADLAGVTATAAEVNILDGATVTTAEVNYNDIASLGTGAASKSIVLDATGNYAFPASHTFTKTLVALTGSTSITALLHSDRTLYITGTSAAAYTLPEATGTGNVYTFHIGEVNTNGTTFVAADTSNTSFRGTMQLLDLDAAPVAAFAASSGDDTLTMDGTTKGGGIGDFVTFTDMATDLWFVFGSGIVPAGSNVADPWSSAA